MARTAGVFRVGRYALNRLGGGWAVVWRDDGGVRRRYRLPAGARDEAEQAVERFARGQELIHAKGATTLGELWSAYLDDRRLEGRASVPIMEHNWKALGPRFGHLLPTMVTKKVCMEYAALRRREGRAEATILTELRRVRTLLSWAEQVGRIDKAPQIWLPPEPRARERWLTKDEGRRLIDGASSPHIRLYLILALATAGRTEALLDLTWGRVDLEAGLIYLDDPGRERTAKGRATVPINDMARAALVVAREAALTDYVIEWRRDRVRSIKKGFAEARRRSGVEHCTPHDLRRTAASWMVMAGVPMERVARYLGHTSTRMVERVYGRFSPDYLADAAKAVSLDLRRRVV